MEREILLRARGFLGDILLDPPPPSLTPRQTEGPYRELAKAFLTKGFRLRTNKTLVGSPVAEIHVNVQPVNRVPAFLIRMESGFVVPENDDMTLLSRYERVFSWDLDLCASEGFDWVRHPQDFPKSTAFEWPAFEDRYRFACLIATNKSLRKATPNDLYLERQKIIRWFECHAPGQFDLYGRHWGLPMDRPGMLSKLARAAGKLGLRKNSLKTYKGAIPDKAPTLRRTKFNFALENVAGLNGYLTEKLFDTFYEGCVPIFWGDPLVTKTIPNETYVRYWEFSSMDNLHDYLESIDSDNYRRFQFAIRSFLLSSQARLFSSDVFAEVVCKRIIERLEG